MKNNVLIALFIISLLLTATKNIALAQQTRYISGRITDATDGEPVPAATVFIAGTTVGTVADLEGYYRLSIPGEGSYQLTVSHVGYQPLFIDIEPGKALIIYDVSLNINEIDDVTVNMKVRVRQRDITLFWKTLLGIPPSKRTIRAINPEAVYYYYNAETKILNVTCREPIQIINSETGFHIQLVLDHFTHDYNTELTSWKFEPKFTELIPENNKQKTAWDRNRKNVYHVSMTNFIKSLYSNTLMENGYLLTYPQRSYTYGNLHNTYENQDFFLSDDSNVNCKTFYIPPDKKDLILICFGEPVTPSLLENVNRAQDTQAKAYQKSTESAWFRGRQNPEYQWPKIGLFRNIIETPSGPVCIYPDGTSNDQFKLSPFLSGSLAGLNMMLPSNYNPDTDTEAMYSVNENDFAENEQASNTDNPSQIAYSLLHAFDEQLEVYPQEKIHLHTDRDLYVPGEKIWFKTYLLDAHTHLYQTLSQYVFIELISPNDSLISRVMIRPVNDMFYGYIPITDIIPEGNYTLRAYTRYMENLGDEYFFKKNIRITSLRPSPLTPLQKRREIEKENLDNPKNLDYDFDVSFFPEGGNLVDGVVNKIAFKALNANGHPEKISGRLINENGIEIATVETYYAGMGVFTFMPESGKKYFLQCRNGNGIEKQFVLPQSAPRAYTLTVSQYNKRIFVGNLQSANTPEIPFYLLAHCRGTVLYFAAWSQKNKYISFSEEELPSGIIQFVLFDEQMHPLSERLAFNKNYDENMGQIEFQTDKSVYTIRDKIVATLSFLPSLSERDGVRSHFSVAVTDDKDIAVDSTTTILSTLLLSSELKGYIENPAWYLQDNIHSVTALDYLMMTHGWRRNNVPEVVIGNPEYPQIPFQTSQEITGQVKSMTFFGSVSESEVTILSHDGGFGITSTDEKGLFRFEDCDFPDSISFYMQALNKQGSNRVELILDSISFPKLIHAIQSPYLTPTLSKGEGGIKEETKNEPEADIFIEKAAQRSRYDEDMRLILLDEVEVTARRIEHKDEQRLRYWMNGSATQTIRKEAIERVKPRNITDVLIRTVPGVEISTNVDGFTTFIKLPNALGLPLVYIDGNEYTWGSSYSPLDIINIRDVESIDVIPLQQSAIFGARGGGGAISITTKKGTENISQDFNYTVYTPLGYQKPVEFYSPNYETLEAKYLSIPDYRTTIFWKPDVIISEDTGDAVFEFYTSDFPTTYSVVIEGLTNDGKIVRQVETIKVE